MLISCATSVLSFFNCLLNPVVVVVVVVVVIAVIVVVVVVRMSKHC